MKLTMVGHEPARTGVIDSGVMDALAWLDEPTLDSNGRGRGKAAPALTCRDKLRRWLEELVSNRHAIVLVPCSSQVGKRSSKGLYCIGYLERADTCQSGQARLGKPIIIQYYLMLVLG